MSIPLPHGAKNLCPRLVQGEQHADYLARAKAAQRIELCDQALGDLCMLGIGAFTPLTGFMGLADWRSVCTNMQLANGLLWPIPITLSVDNATANQLKVGQEVGLWHPQEKNCLAWMQIEEKYEVDKSLECREVYQTVDAGHPGVAMVLARGEVNLAGTVWVLSSGSILDTYKNLLITPESMRALFKARGWQKVAAFQTRNPLHRAHEYLIRNVLEWCDGVLIHSLLGKVKADDIPAEVRTRAIHALIDNYLPKERIVEAGYPMSMRYAGPREAVLHAIFRQNYGCSHIVIGRDHAGVGQYYAPYAAQAIFDSLPKNALHIEPVKMRAAFWCTRCESMATDHTCPHKARYRLDLSGTEVRRRLMNKEPLPSTFSREEVVAILTAYYQSLNESP